MSLPNRQKSTTNRNSSATKPKKSKETTAPKRQFGTLNEYEKKGGQKGRSSWFAPTSAPSPPSSSSSLSFTTILGEEEDNVTVDQDILEHLYDTDNESVQEEEPLYLQQPTLIESVDFFEEFGTIPDIGDISPDISLFSKPLITQVKRVESQDPNYDVGRFVHPLTGEILSSSQSQLTTDLEVTTKTSEIVEEKLPQSDEVESSHSDTELEIPDEMFEDDKELEKVIDAEEEALEFFLEMNVKKPQIIEDEVDWQWIAQQEEAKRIRQNAIVFINDLIFKVVESSEYLDPKVVLRQNLDKRKLMLEISKKLHELGVEERIGIFLNQKAVEFFKRRKSYRPILPDNLKYFEREIRKYRHAVERLDRLLGKESNEIESTARRQKELETELAEMTDIAKIEINRFDEMVKTNLMKDSRPKCNELIGKLLGQMSKCRHEVSKVRFEMLIKQHAKATLMGKISQIEDLGNGLTMTKFSALQTETLTLGKKTEERNVELKKLHLRVRNDIHLMAHYKEKQQMLRNSIAVQRMALEELMDEKQAWRERIYELKRERNRVRQQLNELRFKGGLIDKPALMFDYDRTCEKVEERREVVNFLKETLQALQEKIKETLNQCQLMRLSVM